jgi:hypothetical protein
VCAATPTLFAPVPPSERPVLRSTTLSAERIAADVGYKSPTAFGTPTGATFEFLQGQHRRDGTV